VTMSNQKTFHLSAEEAAFIVNLMSEESSFSDLLRRHPDIRVDREIVTLDRTGAELLRDYFTERVARVGFDADYKPNKDGLLLEKLIDTFYLPAEGWAPDQGADQ
jgi:hypothetical protein